MLASNRRAARSRARKDAEDAFTGWFEALHPCAFRVAYRLLADRQAAEDVASEAFSRAFARWAEVGALPYRDAWVLRVTTNLALTALGRRSPLPPEAGQVVIEDANATRLALAAALRSLPSRQREVIVLRYLTDLPERDIADLLRISSGTVKTHMKRGLAGLRGTLTDEHGASSFAL